MPEDRRSFLQDVIDEVIGLRPPSWELVPKIVQTVQHLASIGHVILVGRAAALVTGGMSNVFHVRLIASLPKRIERVQNSEHLLPREAARFIAENDRGRQRYVMAHFRKRIDDNLQYHLVLNTDLIAARDAAELITDGARKCFQSTAKGAEEKVAA
jgi:cytidylate kinase